MEATIRDKAERGIKTYLERQGFEIMEEDWAHGSDRIDFIADDEGELAFIDCRINDNDGHRLARARGSSATTATRSPSETRDLRNPAQRSGPPGARRAAGAFHLPRAYRCPRDFVSGACRELQVGIISGSGRTTDSVPALKHAENTQVDDEDADEHPIGNVPREHREREAGGDARQREAGERDETGALARLSETIRALARNRR